MVFRLFGRPALKPAAVPAVHGVLERIGGQANAAVGGSEDFVDSFYVVDVRKTDGALTQYVLFHGEDMPAGFGEGARITFVPRKLSSDEYGTDLAVDGRTMRVFEPAVTPDVTTRAPHTALNPA